MPSSSRGQWRRLLFWAIVLQIAGVVLFITALLLGENSRPTLVLLYAPRFPLLVAALTGALLAPLARHAVRLLVAVQGVLCVVVLFPVMGLTLATSRPVDQPIHLATYNVYFGRRGSSALIDEIAVMPADIVVIQAAFDSLGAKLRDRLPDRTVRQDDELILVSKFPVRSVEVPPPLPDGTPPMFVEYVIDTPRGALRVFNVHAYSPRQALFGLSEADGNIAQREGQIAAVVAAARDDVPPFVIAGDTNLPALSAIGRRHFSGLTDAFADVGFGFGYTFPSRRSWMRIDRVLGSDEVRFADIRVAPRGASDHCALFVDLDLNLALGG